MQGKGLIYEDPVGYGRIQVTLGAVTYENSYSSFASAARAAETLGLLHAGGAKTLTMLSKRAVRRHTFETQGLRIYEVLDANGFTLRESEA